jgi:hypothetical protein
MPSRTATAATTKHWGKVDKAALHRLAIDGNVDIKDLSYENIHTVQEQYFSHRTVCNFWCNFNDFSDAFNLEQKLSGARPVLTKHQVRCAAYSIANICI